MYKWLLCGIYFCFKIHAIPIDLIYNSSLQINNNELDKSLVSDLYQIDSLADTFYFENKVSSHMIRERAIFSFSTFFNREMIQRMEPLTGAYRFGGAITDLLKITA